MTVKILIKIIGVIVAGLFLYFAMKMHRNRINYIRKKSSNRAEIRRRINLESDTKYGIVAGIGLVIAALESFADSIKNNLIAIPLKIAVWFFLAMTVVASGIEVYNRILSKRKERNNETNISNRDSSDLPRNDNHLNDEKESRN